jgi:hypothetical protein
MLPNITYLCEFETEFKKALARESRAQGVLFDEKTDGRKSHDTVPLRTTNKIISRYVYDNYNDKMKKLIAGVFRIRKANCLLQLF